MKRNQQVTSVALSSGSTGFYETTNSGLNPSYIRLVIYNANTLFGSLLDGSIQEHWSLQKSTNPYYLISISGLI